jgi:hypothetical protein
VVIRPRRVHFCVLIRGDFASVDTASYTITASAPLTRRTLAAAGMMPPRTELLDSARLSAAEEARHTICLTIFRTNRLRGVAGPADSPVQSFRGPSGDCQEFLARLGMMGSKEPSNAATQGAYYS